jgi:hypothetical protein
MEGENIFQISAVPWRMAPAISRTTFYVIAALSITILVLQSIHAYVTAEDKPYVAPKSLSSAATLIGHIRNFLYQFRLRHPSIFPEAPSTAWSRRGFLERLPLRKDCQQNTTTTISRCQQNPLTPIERCSALSSTIRGIATAYPQLTYLGRSTFETHNKGEDNNNSTATLFARCRTYSGTKYFGEICRSYPEDGSMHLKLHPADVKMVLESGWGERQPPAMTNWWWKCLTGAPTGDTLIYAPRSEQELAAVTEIIRAAVWWVGKHDSESWS